LQERISFTISLHKLNARFHACPCVLIWHPPCTNFYTRGPRGRWIVIYPLQPEH
jgi:hypothetical protein